MRVNFLCIFVIFFYSISAFAQKRLDYKTKSSSNIGYKRAKIDLDSVWAFSPGFCGHISAGVWIPMGSLREQFFISPRFGIGYGFMLSHRLKFELNFNLHAMNHRKEVLFNADTSAVNAKSISSFGMGFTFYHTLAKSKLFHVDLLAGAGYEIIDSNIELPKAEPNDDRETVMIGTFRIDFGALILVNAIKDRNLGVRVFGSYAPYNIDPTLRTSIGNYSLSTSLVYFFPKRRQVFRAVYL